MYIVRETFIAKPGYASQLAQLMKDEMETWKGFKGHVLIDLVTDYNKVVVEYEIENLAEFDKMMNEYMKQRAKSGAKAKRPKHVDMYLMGNREIYRIV